MNQMGKTIFDIHGHSSKYSDGEIKSHEFIKLLNTTQAETTAALTDHNVVNYELIEKLEYIKQQCFIALGVEVDTYEINTHGEGTKQYAHLMVYANEFNQEFTDILSSIRENKQGNIVKIILRLQNNGFHIDTDSMYSYFLETYGNDKNINCFLLAKYIVQEEENRKLVQKEYNLHIENTRDGAVTFMKRVLGENLYRKGLEHIGIEPQILSELSEKNNGLLTLVHPHTTFKHKGPEWFRENGERYCRDRNILAIEISSLMPPEWLEVVFYVVKKAKGKLKLTAGGDSHGNYNDGQHDFPLSTNKFIPEDSEYGKTILDARLEFNEQYGHQGKLPLDQRAA